MLIGTILRMQKILALFLLAGIAMCGVEYCNFFKGFGMNFAGESCASDLNSCCSAGFDAIEQIKKIIGGDMNAFMKLVADVMQAYSNLVSSVTACKFEEYLMHFIKNITKIYTIIIAHLGELQKDLACVVSAFKEEDCFRLGGCIGHFLKIILASDKL